MKLSWYNGANGRNGYAGNNRRRRRAHVSKEGFPLLIRRFRNCRLSVKIIATFSLVLLLTTAAMYMLMNVQLNRLRYAEFDRIVQQNTRLITNNIDAMLVNASYVTKMLIANNNVQKLLTDRASFETPTSMQTLRLLLGSVTNMQPYIAGVYLFNTRSQRFGMDNYSMQSFSFKALEDAPWYKNALEQKGFYVIRLNGGEKSRMYGNQNVISMIRLVFNIDQQTSMIGAVMLNMREQYFISTFEDFEREYNAEVVILEDGGTPIFYRDQPYFDALTPEQRDMLTNGDGPVGVLQAKDGSMLSYSSMATSKAPWHVIVALPYTGEVKGLMGTRSLFFLLLGMEVVLIFCGAVIVTRMVARPIRQLTGAMHLSEGERPQRVEMPRANGEIGELKDTYNRMVERIDELFRRVEDESERKRQAEFHALQAQINPHFLYNTIDTARGLVLSNRTADLNRLLRNLGEFYRNSINNGRNVVSLREEIHMVRSYMDIQQIRYADIRTVYDVDDSVCDVRIPKLVIQPLVENALYHGIRPQGNRGTIELKVWGDETLIYVRVSDDGVGIDPTIARHVFDEIGNPLNRFGLQGTLDRLRLYYRQENVLSIEYGAEVGTRMTLLIPRDGAQGDPA